MLTWGHFIYKVQIFWFNQLGIYSTLMEKLRIWCSEQNNYSNCSLPPGALYPQTMFEKKICHSENIIDKHYCSHIIYNWCSTKQALKHFFSYCWTLDHLLWNLFSLRYITSVRFMMKTSITLVNVVHSYNKNWSWLYLVVILVKTVGGCFPPLYPIWYHIRLF